MLSRDEFDLDEEVEKHHDHLLEMAHGDGPPVPEEDAWGYICRDYTDRDGGKWEDLWDLLSEEEGTQFRKTRDKQTYYDAEIYASKALKAKGWEILGPWRDERFELFENETMDSFGPIVRCLRCKNSKGAMIRISYD
jgi:hypothetical protein